MKHFITTVLLAVCIGGALASVAGTKAPDADKATAYVRKVGELKGSAGLTEYFVIKVNIAGYKMLRDLGAEVGIPGNVLDLRGVEKYYPLAMRYDVQEKIGMMLTDDEKGFRTVEEFAAKWPGTTFNVAFENTKFWGRTEQKPVREEIKLIEQPAKREGMRRHGTPLPLTSGTDTNHPGMRRHGNPVPQAEDGGIR